MTWTPTRPLSRRPRARLALNTAWLAGLACSSLSTLACSSDPELAPLPPPRVVRSVRHEAGGALASGTTSEEDQSSTSQPWIASLHLVALESLPDRGEPLVDHLRLISQSRSPRLLETRLELLSDARRELLDEPAAAVAAALAAGRATSCGRLRAALLPDTATVFDLAVDRFAEAESAREGLALRLARWGEELEVALVARQAASGEGELLEVLEEVALLERLPSGIGLLLLIPAPFDPGYAGYALALDCTPAKGIADLHLVHEGRVQRLAAATAPVATESPTDRAPRPQTLAAVQAPEVELAQWSALAQEVGATLSERLLLVGDPEFLERARGSWRAALQAPPEQLGWRIEQVTVRALLESEAPWCRALLLDRCGALGAEPLALRDSLDAARNLAGWEEQLRRENRYLLRNAMAGVRARAYDWLRARGLAPTGYDPFGPREARRAALKKAGS